MNGNCSCTHKQVKGLGQVSNASDMMNMSYTLMDLGPYNKYFGAPATNVKIMLTGEPGAGKTMFLLKLANWFATNVGSALYISSEEYGSPTLSEKLKQIKGLTNNLHFAGTKDAIKESRYIYDFVVLDSVQDMKLTMDEFKALTEKWPETAFVIVLQKTKDGKFKGDKEWEHLIDIAGDVRFNEDGKRVLYIHKNRYGVMGENLI